MSTSGFFEAPVVLFSRGIVEVAGADAASFLQGLITNDVTRAGAGRGVYAALLTPQGKVIYDFIVFADNGRFLLDCVKHYAADLTQRLVKYKLRAKVTVTDRSSELKVLSARSASTFPEGAVATIIDPRLEALGLRAIVPSQLATGEDESVYCLNRLQLGVPEALTDIPPETFFPLDCNFEELHGVDFDKGCYVGQELTARMKHRASARRRILPVEAAVRLPLAGTALKLGSSDIGELRGGIGNRGLALVRLDRLGDAREAMAGDIPVKIGRPAYPLILPGDEPV